MRLRKGRVPVAQSAALPSLALSCKLLICYKFLKAPEAYYTGDNNRLKRKVVTHPEKLKDLK